MRPKYGMQPKVEHGACLYLPLSRRAVNALSTGSFCVFVVSICCHVRFQTLTYRLLLFGHLSCCAVAECETLYVYH